MATILSNHTLESFEQAVVAEAKRVVATFQPGPLGSRILAILQDVNRQGPLLNVDEYAELAPWQQLRQAALLGDWLEADWRAAPLRRWVNRLTDSARADGVKDGPQGLDLIDFALEAIRNGYRDGGQATGTALMLDASRMVVDFAAWARSCPDWRGPWADRLDPLWWSGAQGPWRRTQVTHLDVMMPTAVAAAWVHGYSAGWADARAMTALVQWDAAPSTLLASRAAVVLNVLPDPDMTHLPLPGLFPWQRRRTEVLSDHWRDTDASGAYSALDKALEAWVGEEDDEIFALVLEALETAAGRVYQVGFEYGASHLCIESSDSTQAFHMFWHDWVEYGVRPDVAWHHLGRAMGTDSLEEAERFYAALLAALRDMAWWMWGEAAQDGQALAPLHLPRLEEQVLAGETTGDA